MSRGRNRVAALLGGGALLLGMSLAGSNPSYAEPDIDKVQKRVDTLYHQAEQAQERYHDVQLQLKDLRRDLETRWTLADTAERTGGPARYVRVAETGGRIGFITPLTHNFCESCNRVRLTCTGQLFMCLGQEDEADLRAPLRAHPGDDAPLTAAITAAIARKPKGHDFDYSRQTVTGQVSRHMSHTGG